MTIPTRIVTSHFEHPDGTPYANEQISFRLQPWSYTAGSVVLAGSIPDTTDASGNASTVLWTNAEGMRPSRYTVMFPNGEQSRMFVLPAGTTPISLDELFALAIEWGVPDIEDLLDARDASIYGAFANTADIALGDELVGATLTNDGIQRTVHDVLDFFDDELERHDAQFAVTTDTTLLSVGSAINAAAITVLAPPATARIGSWMLVAFNTPDCEARKIVSVAGNVVTLNAPLEKPHAAGSVVYWQPTPAFHAAYWGCKSDGNNDSSAFLELLDAAHEYSGTIILPLGVTRIDSKILVPSYVQSGQVRPRMNTIRITGQGTYGDWPNTHPAAGDTSMLDLRYHGGVDQYEDYRIDSRGTGTLEIDHVVITDLAPTAYVAAGSQTPFMRSTNTNVQIHDCAFLGSPNRSGNTCDQDFIVLGGERADQVDGGGAPIREYSGGPRASFQGYGTRITNNWFNKVRRAVLMYDDVNSVDVTFNKIWNSSGSNLGSAAAAIDLVGSHPQIPITGNKILYNSIEAPDYVYPIALRSAINTQLIANDIWDSGAGTLAGVAILGASSHNYIVVGWSNDSHPYVLNLSSVDDNTVLTSHSGQTSEFGGALRAKSTLQVNSRMTLAIPGNVANQIDVQPSTAGMATGSALMRIRRSSLEGTDPSTLILNVAHSGKQTWGGAFAGQLDILNQAGVVQMTISQAMKSFIGNGTGAFVWDTGGGGGSMSHKAASHGFYDAAGVLLFNLLNTGQLRFGTDQGVNLYPTAASGSNQLKTDDEFIAGLGLQVLAGEANVGAAAGGKLAITRLDTTVTALDSIGKIEFRTIDASPGNTNPIAAEIEVIATNTITTDINPGVMVFRTTPVTVAATPTERLRIDQNGLFTFAEASNIALGTATGTKLGTATSQKLGLWNATPDVQPTSAISAAAFVANTSGIANDSATYGGYTMGQIVAALKRIGALA